MEITAIELKIKSFDTNIAIRNIKIKTMINEDK